MHVPSEPSDLSGLFNALDGKGPETWNEYLRSYQQGEAVPHLSMLAIYEHLYPIAMREVSLEWAGVAIRAAELEARDNRDASARESMRLGAMRARAFMISKLGSRPDHFVLDRDIILRWVLDGYDAPVLAMQKRAISLRKLLATPNEARTRELQKGIGAELKVLRVLKHRLRIVQLLAECGELPDDSPLREWLKLFELLI